MGFLCILFGLIEWTWCILMPVIGSLHLISKKYQSENADKRDLFKHWCYYWIAFFVLRVAFQFLSFLPSAITSILCILRVSALSVMASPKLGITTGVFESILSRTSSLSDLKDMIINMAVSRISGEKEKK